MNKKEELKMKKQSGITLIALIVTIIVLLILAAVSLRLVAGEQGILARAEGAVQKNELGAAKEQAELVVADYAMQYLEEKYEQGNSVPDTAGAYLAEVFEAPIKAGDYYLKAKEGKLYIYKEVGCVNEITHGTIKSDGTIEWTDSAVVNPPDNSVPATGITLSETAATREKGWNLTLAATPTPADTTDEIIWSTSNSAVATVLNGVVTTVGAGEATITATCGGVTADCMVTVEDNFSVFDYTFSKTYQANGVDLHFNNLTTDNPTIGIWAGVSFSQKNRYPVGITWPPEHYMSQSFDAERIYTTMSSFLNDAKELGGFYIGVTLGSGSALKYGPPKKFVKCTFSDSGLTINSVDTISENI